MRRFGRGLAAMAMAAAALVPVAPAGAAPAWSIVPSGNAPGVPSGALVTVACPSATTCFALGGYGNVSMMQQWDGSEWRLASAAPAPGPANATGPFLTGLACVSETFCIVAGGYQVNGISHPLAERWDGSTWAVMSSPDLTGVSFTSVACPSATSCFATGAGGPYPQKTLVQHWDGNAWSTMSTPNVANTDSELSGIACATATLCFAVGAAGNGPAAPRTLVEQWDGMSWTIVASPNPSGSNTFPFLAEVACPSATACYAAGNYDQGQTTRTIIERWDGATWSLATSPNAAGASNNDISGLACPTPTDCFAVGTSRNASNGALHDLFLRGGTGSWSIVAYASNEPRNDDLRDVACASPSTCFAVGYNQSKNTMTIEQWNGTSWTNLTVAQPSLPNSTLSDVACAGTVCFAVGHSSVPLGSPTKTLIERRTPSGWTVVNSPNPSGGRQVTLTGVSCPTTTLCFAAGTWDGKTLIERWNGKAWSIVPSPNNPQWGGQLTDVSCASAKFCFAVGDFQGETIETLTERWNGAAWKIVPSPSRRPSPQFELEGVNNLESVSCVSATSCVAVGNDAGYLFDFTETLVEHWNGSKWAIVKSPNPAKFSNLAAVSCVTAKNCYAVGNAAPTAASTATMQTLIVHWNGSVWTRVTSADPTPAPRNTLLGVSCPSATSCVAVGDSRNGTADQTLVKRLTGNQWSIEPSPDPTGAIQASLHGVGCTSATACVAVGDSIAPQTLVEQYG